MNFGGFYHLIRAYKAELLTRNEFIERWEKYQRSSGITLYKKCMCYK